MVDINQYRLSENSFRFEQLQLNLVEDVKKIPWIQLLLISMDDVFHTVIMCLLAEWRKWNHVLIEIWMRKYSCWCNCCWRNAKTTENMKLITSFKVLSKPSNYFTVYYQNVRSFNKHYSWNCCRRFQYGWKLKRHSWKISSTNFKTNKRI